MNETARLLAELVRIPSVNPMGRDVAGPEFLEGRMADFLVAAAPAWNLACERHEVSPGRDNILLGIPGDRGLVLLDAHLDTVPVDGMTIPPFEPQLRDGRLYGRGACDVKGGLAAMIAVLRRLVERPASGRPAVTLSCTVNEEFGFTGAKHLAELWKSGGSNLLPRRPDFAVVAEPTLLCVVTAHKGVVRWRASVLGKAVHSSRPEAGVSAIYGMARVLSALEEYAKSCAPALGSHPLLGRPSLSVGTIAGGISVNTVPDRCTIEIDRRLLPGENPAAARQAVIDFITDRVGDSIRLQHEAPMTVSPGLDSRLNGPLAQRLVEAVRATGRDSESLGVPYGTNAAAFGDELPTVVFGPGSIDQAHTADEWIALDQLDAAASVLTRFLQPG